MTVIYQWLLEGFNIFQERIVLAIESSEQKMQYNFDLTELFTLIGVVSWVLENT